MVFVNSAFAWTLAATAASASAIAPRGLLPNLFVDDAPNSPRPYVLRHYAHAQAVSVGSQIYRFPVTGASSGGAFSLLLTDAPNSNALGVSPHIHERHYENFYNFKGRYQLWTQSKLTADGPGQQSRILQPGDFGAVPINTTHTFQILDPDTELLGVIVPGGFE